MVNKGIIRSDSDQSDILGQEYEESIAEKSEKKSDRSIPNWVKVSEKRFNLTKQIINKNKDLGTGARIWRKCCRKNRKNIWSINSKLGKSVREKI